MATNVKVLYCAAGNRKFADIAIKAGFHYGAQLPATVYFPPFFADQDWKRPDRARYIGALSIHKPAMASVLDWEHPDQLSEVLAWAHDAALYADSIMLIPKVMGGIDKLPRSIGGKPVILGYSVPTKHGGTSLPLWEFAGWPVHLLGGAPQAQMKIYQHLTPMADVVSVDGNYAQKMAVQYGQFWQPGNAHYANNRYWPKLSEAGDMVMQDVPYEAFRRSCIAIMQAWQAITDVETYTPLQEIAA